MFSSVVKNKTLKIVFYMMTLVAGCAIEELAPRFCGVGFPVLMFMTFSLALEKPIYEYAIFAVAAGGMEEAISALPIFTGAGFFLVAAALTRLSKFPLVSALLAYPMYQLYLSIWSAGDVGGFFLPTLIALPVGLVTAFAVDKVMTLSERMIALEEEE